MTKPKKYTSAKPPKALIKKKRTNINYKASYALSKPFKAVLEKTLAGNTSLQYKDREYRRAQYPSTMQSGIELVTWLPEINQSASTPSLTNPVIPNTSGTRQGKSIRMKSSYAKLCFTIPPDDMEEEEDRSCITVICMLLSSKQYPDIKDVQNNWGTGTEIRERLMDGGGAGIPEGANNESYAGRVGDELMRVNTRDFTVHDKKIFDLKRGSLPGGSVVPGGENLGGHMPAIKKNITLRWKCKNKILNYSNSDSLYPTNASPFLFIGFSYSATGAAPSSAGVPFMYGRVYSTWENLTS